MKADKKPGKSRNISYTKVALSFLLTLFKLLAGFLGNSILLLADAVRSFSEFINECIKILNISIENRPEDKSHNYGHGKIETLCKGAGAVIILCACLYVFYMGSEQLLMYIQGKELKTPELIALFAAVLTFVLKEIIFIVIRDKKITELKAIDISSEGYPHIKELFVSGFVILGIGCTFISGRYTYIADSLASVILILYLLLVSGNLFYGTVNELIEASLDEETNCKIREIINGIEGVTESKELKTRKIGKGIAINACISVDNSLSIQDAAKITDIVEQKLKAAFGEDAYTLIKVEPDTLKTLTFHNRNTPSEEGKRKTPIKI